MRYEKHITRIMLRKNPNILFVFGDNMIGEGFGGRQAKEMRGEPNAVGIPTKNYPGTRPEHYFGDNDFDKARIKIDFAFERLLKHARSGKQIVWPFDGIGTGLAELPKKSPKIWAYLEDKKIALEQLYK